MTNRHPSFPVTTSGIKFWIWLLLWLGTAALAQAQAQDTSETRQSQETQDSSRVSVRIDGVEGELLANVRAFLGIVERSKAEKPSLVGRLNPFNNDEPEGQAAVTPAQVRRLHRRAPGEIHQALQPYGYYDPTVNSELRRTEDGWLAIYRIDPGPPTMLDRVTIDVRGEGRDEAAVQQVLDEVDIATGQRLEHAKYESIKARLFEAAYQAGYLDARYVDSQIRVMPERQRAEIVLRLNTGPRYYFGTVQIEQDILNPSFVQRFVDIDSGTPFNSQELLDLQLVLNDSDYFSQVEIQADKAQARDQQVPVTVTTEPRPSRKYTAGAGYGTDTGPRVRLGAELRRINRRGHQLHFNLLASAVERSLLLEYRIPFKDIARDYYAFSASGQQGEFGDADSDRFTVGVSRNDGWRGFRRRTYLEYRRENFDFSGPGEKVGLLYPGLTLTRKVTDDDVFTRRGYSVTADVHGGAEPVLSDTTFGHAELNARAVYPWSERGRLLFHSQLGGLWTDNFPLLPPSQRFYAGGDRSVRGYPYQDIGPTDVAGDTIGGKFLLLGSIEADYLFYGNYGAAVFFDAGDSFIDSPDFKKSAGVGFRWRSPVGMVRLDFAHPFDDRDEDLRFHLSIGSDL